MGGGLPIQRGYSVFSFVGLNRPHQTLTYSLIYQANCVHRKLYRGGCDCLHGNRPEVGTRLLAKVIRLVYDLIIAKSKKNMDPE